MSYGKIYETTWWGNPVSGGWGGIYYDLAIQAFIFTVQTDNTGTSNDDQFTLPLTNNGTVNINVDWGDGTSDIITAFDQAEKTHTYPSAGTYEIQITGTLQGWRFSNGGDCVKMLDIKNYGVLNINTDDTFQGCANLTQSATDAPIISTTDLSATFSGCRVFNGDVSNWDVSNVTNFNQVFRDSRNFNQDISNWDVSSGTSFNQMFAFGTDLFNQPIGKWDTSSATNMKNMLQAPTNFDQDLSNWDVSNVTDMTNLLANTTLSTANYDAILISWAAQSVQNDIVTSFGSSQYTAGGAAEAARNTLINTYNWTITDGGAA